MNEIDLYFKEKHSTLKNNYRTPDGKYSESCFYIAIEIAKILLKLGEKPSIVSFQETNASLKPLMFNGISWGAHVVCCANGLVYDPILEKPISIKQYSQTVFGRKVPMRIISDSNIEEFVNR